MTEVFSSVWTVYAEDVATSGSAGRDPVGLEIIGALVGAFVGTMIGVGAIVIVAGARVGSLDGAGPFVRRSVGATVGAIVAGAFVVGAFVGAIVVGAIVVGASVGAGYVVMPSVMA